MSLRDGFIAWCDRVDLDNEPRKGTFRNWCERAYSAGWMQCFDDGLRSRKQGPPAPEPQPRHVLTGVRITRRPDGTMEVDRARGEGTADG